MRKQGKHESESYHCFPGRTGVSNGEAVDAAHLGLLLAVLREGDDELQRGLALGQARWGLDQHPLWQDICNFQLYSVHTSRYNLYSCALES